MQKVQDVSAMVEPLSSNLVADLRRMAPDIEGDSFLERAVLQAADEIERLTAEQHGLTLNQVKSLQTDYGAHVKALADMKAERDSLRLGHCLEIVEERDRLAAALREAEMVYRRPGRSPVEHLTAMIQIMQKALAGEDRPKDRPADETTERWPCPYCRAEFPSKAEFQAHIKCMRDEVNGEGSR